MAQRNFIITLVLMLLIIASTSFAATCINGDLSTIKMDVNIYECSAGKDYIAAKATCDIPLELK